MKDPNTPDTAGRIQGLIAEQAGEWLIRMEDVQVGADQRAAFTDWLTASPANVSEFLNARATWEALSGRAFDHLPDDETLLREMGAAPASGVVPLHAPIATRTSRRFFAIAAGIAVLAVGAGAIFWAMRASDPNHAVYMTTAGEQTTHLLPDGSSVALNTRSRVQLQWSGQFRDLRLEAGEALFEVARDPVRPFRVWVGPSVIQAVGTRFNVHQSGRNVTITVLEGRVEVKSDGTATQSTAGVLLGAGEQTRIDSQKPLQTRHLSAPERAVAWQERRLIFDGEPLAKVIEEFNRYYEIPLVLEDTQLGAKRIHGIFDAADRASLITFLEETDRVQTEQRKDALVVRRR